MVLAVVVAVMNPKIVFAALIIASKAWKERRMLVSLIPDCVQATCFQIAGEASSGGGTLSPGE